MAPPVGRPRSVLKIGFAGNGYGRRKESAIPGRRASVKKRKAIRGASQERHAEGPGGEDREHPERLEEGRQEGGGQAQEVIFQDEEVILMVGA